MRTGLVAVMLVVAGCGNATGEAAPACDAATYPADPLMPGEVEATTDSGVEAWALLFLTDQTATTGEPVTLFVSRQVKVVWSITGEGAFAVTAVGPEGRIIESDWEPQGHGGSNWERPGDEWDTGWTFPEPGCWEFRVSRGSSTATLKVKILG